MILGASFDTAAENRAFAEKFHFNFPLICDTDHSIGADGKVRKAYGTVKPAEHPAEVLQDA